MDEKKHLEAGYRFPCVIPAFVAVFFVSFAEGL
jgi:hypothetical protein